MGVGRSSLEFDEIPDKAPLYSGVVGITPTSGTWTKGLGQEARQMWRCSP